MLAEEPAEVVPPRSPSEAIATLLLLLALLRKESYSSAAATLISAIRP